MTAASVHHRSPAGDRLRAVVDRVRAKQPPERHAVEAQAVEISGALLFVAPDPEGRRLVMTTFIEQDAREAARAHTPSTLHQAWDGRYVVFELIGAER